ncbi:MAG: hypothetical protein V2A34_10165, partial [Lentisphaerota bacterium]
MFRKNKVKEDLSPAGRRRGFFYAAFHGLKWSVRLCLLGIFALLSLVLYLNLVGFPGILKEKWTLLLRQEGYYVDIHKLAFDVFDGITARKVRWYEKEDSTIPFLEADELGVSIPLADLFRDGPKPWKIRIHNGLVRYGMEEDALLATRLRDLVLRKMDATVIASSGGVRVEEVHGLLLGIQWSAAGNVISPPASTNVVRTNPAEVFRLIKKYRPVWLPEFVEQLNAIEFGPIPQAQLEFTLDLPHPASNDVALNLRGGKTRSRGVALDEWRLSAKLRRGQVVMDTCTVKQKNKKFQMSGLYDLGSTKIQARIFNTLPPSEWVKLLPASWAQDLAQKNQLADAQFSCDVKLGPATLEQVRQRISGWFSVERARLQGVWVEKGFVSFTQKNSLLSIDRLEAVLGQGVHRGSLSARCDYDQKAGSYEGQATMHFDPNVL